MASKRQDDPVFTPLKNSNLVCANCVLRAESDFSVLACSAYDMKPSYVLDGKDCPKHMTLEQAMEKYGKG